MLAQALETLIDVAQEASQPKPPIVHEIASGDPHTKRFLMPDGKTIESVTSRTPLRKHTVFDLESFAKWVNGSEEGEATADDSKNGRHVWHHEDAIVLVLDDHAYRENLVTMPLPKHPTFLALKGSQGVTYTQRSLIDFLRLNLKKEVAAAYPDFIAKLRAIKIKQDESGDSNIQHGRESMGKIIDRQVSGADELPDEVTLAIPVWLHLGYTAAIECAFDIDLQEMAFRFAPKPGVIDQAMVAAQEWLHDRLEEECGKSAVIYFGKP